MSSIIDLLYIRYSKPLEALKEDGLLKSLLSLCAFILTTTTHMIDTLGDIFRTPAELILLLAIAIVIDWYTGIMKARRNGVFIRSLGLRQTWVKSIEYAAGLILLSGMANVFGATDIEGWVGDTLRFLKNIHWFGYFYAVFTEFKSVSENIQNKEGRFSEIIRLINQRFFGDKKED